MNETQTFAVAGRQGAKMRKVAEIHDGRTVVGKDCKNRLAVGQIILLDSRARTHCQVTEIEDVIFGDGDFAVVNQHYLTVPCPSPA